jgi:hypothetical protein
MANICLIAVLGTGVLCSGGSDKPAAVSDFCQIAGPEIARLGRMTDAEIGALSRQHKEAVVSLKRKKSKLCK